MKNKFLIILTLMLLSSLFAKDVPTDSSRYTRVHSNNIELNSKEEAALIYDKSESISKTLDESSGDGIEKNYVNFSEYKICGKTYNKNKVRITYPQISGLSDETKLKAINKLLEEEALDILSGYLQDDPKLKNLTLDINYEVKLKNNKYFSVAYSGYGNVKGTAHPLSLFYTTNINVENARGMRLVDYADVMNILKKLKDTTTVKVVSSEEEVAEAQKNALVEMNDGELLSILKDSDFRVENGKIIIPEKGGYSYMEENNIVISLPVSHAIGDHAEFLVKK
ncbi:PdaC/SigV domain-containing protein [Clostridium chromiireducens]|uniref:Deacetylase PdaC domain-containing protein n=1 Tax=Clostridium chromiireducens TaxID=225345 RepID=A0A1V4I7Z5_9CLOT|nr:DUF4163 domain-containing protein [Clostridium chromiireducens]OPJ56102.1 hypothetical protein CLCHR_46020 [Clostridium chromiireducens]